MNRAGKRATSANQPGNSSQWPANKRILAPRDMRRVAEFIGAEVGIQLPASKHTLVESRLSKRLRKLGFDSFKSYLDYVLKSPQGKFERLHLIDAITTNKTSFFRESDHFHYLVEKALPELEKRAQLDDRPQLHIWSAGCSSGEEAYTLSIVLSEAVGSPARFRFNILATDISKSSLETAKYAIYPEQRIAPVAMPLRKKYFMRSSEPEQALVQMGPELRSHVTFASLNLIAEQFSLAQKMDVIFCRNVMIYFDNPIREQLIHRFERQLVPGGYLFIGHSETLNTANFKLEAVSPMVYRKVK